MSKVKLNEVFKDLDNLIVRLGRAKKSTILTVRRHVFRRAGVLTRMLADKDPAYKEKINRTKRLHKMRKEQDQ